MARPRTRKKKEADVYSGPMWAWSDIHKGGESIEMKDGRRIISSREIHPRGSEVAQDDLGVSDEDWKHLVASGSIRPYPLPDGYHDDDGNPTEAALGLSPVNFVLEERKRQMEEAESDAEAESVEDMIVRSSVVGSQIFPPSPEEVLMGVAEENLLPAGVEEGAETAADS